MTANGSSPTCSRAHSTACPSPSGSSWTTSTICIPAGRMPFTIVSRSVSPFRSRKDSRLASRRKWSAMALLLPRVTSTMVSMPASAASSTAYWMRGLSSTGSISFGTDLVAGRNRVPSPATGTTALRTGGNAGISPSCTRIRQKPGDQPGLLMGMTSAGSTVTLDLASSGTSRNRIRCRLLVS